MIKAKNGVVKMKGDVPTFMSDLSIIIKGLMEKKLLDKDDIMKCVEMACMTEEEIDKEIEKVQESIKANLKAIFGDIKFDF